MLIVVFPGGSVGKESACCNEGDLDLILGLGRSLGEGDSYPFQYFCLKNSMDRRAWQPMGSQRVRRDSKFQHDDSKYFQFLFA